MTDKRALVCWVIALVATGAAPTAHHSEAVYDHTVTVLKNATIVEFVWANPHSILTFEVKDQDGKVTGWNAETGPPGSLTRVGWNRNSIHAGDVVTIELNPAKNGASVGRLVKVILPGGQQLLDTQVRKPAEKP